MGKRNRKRVKKMKNINNSASDKDSTEATSASNTVEDGAEEKGLAKSSQMSSDKIQETGKKEKRNRLTEDTKVGQRSHLKESELTDKEITEVLDSVEKLMTVNKRIVPLNLKFLGNVSSAQYQDKGISLAERRRDLYNFLKARNPQIVKAAERSILKPDSLNETSKSDKLHALEYNRERRRDVIDKFKPKATNRSKTKKSNEASNVCPKPYLSIKFWFQKFRRSLKPYLTSLRSKSYIDEYTRTGVEGAIDLLHQYRDLSYKEIKQKDASNEEIKAYEELVDQINDSIIELRNVLDEMSCSPTDYIAVIGESLKNEIEDEVEIKCKENIGRSIFDYIKDFHSDKEMATPVHQTEDCGRQYNKDQTTYNEEEHEDIKASKKQADQVNDLIMELEKIEAKKYVSHVDYVKETEEPLQKATENKAENKGKEDTDISNNDARDFQSEEERLTFIQKCEDFKRKKSKDQAIHPEKKGLKAIDFKHDSKEFTTPQNFSLDNRAEKRDNSLEHKLEKEQPDLFSSEKEPIKAVKTAETHEKSENTTDLKGKEKANETINKLNDEQKEFVIELEKEDDIYFEIETDGSKHIYVGSNYYYYHIKNKQEINFNFKNEGIRISFTGYKIFISTQKNEFDIFVRNFKPFNPNDEATQTENLL